jgi:ubiquinone/menaquinone biosynthesis C-methylase UbiE
MRAGRGASFADWQEVARRWEGGRALLWDSTRSVSEWLVARLDPGPGQTILDLAAGTGETGFLAAPLLAPHGLLISSDRSPNMVEAARRLAGELGIRNVEFRTLDSERIELAAASLDGVLSRFGYILRGDPPPSLAEIRRVLRPGGRVAFAVWAERARNSWMTVPAEVMLERGHVSPPSAAEIRTSERRNPEAITRLLELAGFGEPEIEEMPVSYRFSDATELWRFVSELRGPLSLAFGRLDERERNVVRAAIEERAGGSEPGGYALGGVSLNVVTA